MIYANFLNAIREFVDWLSGLSILTKMWLLVTLMGVGLVILLKHFDAKDTQKTIYYSTKIDSITVFFTRQLENCNNEKSKESKIVIDALQRANDSQQKQNLEIERLKLETERLKLKK